MRKVSSLHLKPVPITVESTAREDDGNMCKYQLSVNYVIKIHDEWFGETLRINKYTNDLEKAMNSAGVWSSQANMRKGKMNMITLYIITQPICKRIKIHDSCTQCFLACLVWRKSSISTPPKIRDFFAQKNVRFSNINRKYQ